MRVLLLLLCAVVLVAAESGPPQVTTVPFRQESNGGFLSLKPGQLSWLGGGVQVWYGGAHLHGDRLDWVLSPFGAARKPVFERVELRAGPQSWQPERVRLDTSACTLEAIGFRGVLAPTGLVVTRRPADPAEPAVARWRVQASDPGHFAGELRSERGWQPYAGWAHEIEFEIAADVSGDQLSGLRFTTIHLFGRQGATSKDRQRCRIDRLRAPLAKADDLAGLGDTPGEFGVKGMSITIEFDDAGRLHGYQLGEQQQIYGVPDVPMRQRSRVTP